MKLSQLFEVPIGNIYHKGDFSQYGSFDYENPKDKDLISSPKHMERLRRLMTKTPYIIDCYFVNLPIETFKKNYTISSGGEIGGTERVKEIFGIDIEANPNAITFVLGSNILGAHRLSVWIIIHRFSHLIEDGIYNRQIDPSLEKSFSNLNTLIEDNLEEIIDQATMASARKGLHTKRSNEMINELITQYLVTGKITLKSNKQLENKLNYMSKDLLDCCVGKIIFGF